MKIVCPSCSAAIPASNLNVEADVALCPRCNEAFSISELVAEGQDADPFDFAEAPRGTWFTETFDGWSLGATTRSPIAFFLVPFMCVWSGFSLGGIYGGQIAQGKFEPGISLFGIPFVLGTLLFGSVAIMSVCGKITLTVQNGDGRLFRGVGLLGWTRRFDWTSITRVEEDYLSNHRSRNPGMVIVLIGKTRLKFGSLLTETRRYFLLQALRKHLSVRKSSKSF